MNSFGSEIGIAGINSRVTPCATHSALESSPYKLGFLTGLTLLLLLAFLEFVIIWKIVSGEIRLKYLVSEANGRASFSRFQFLVFTFVIGGLVSC